MNKYFADNISNNVEKLCSPAIWAEGPVWLANKNGVVFSDVKGNTMFFWSEKTGLSVFRAYSNYANGNTTDSQQRLVTCEHGRRAISRTEHDGSVHILVDQFMQKRFNSPNDVIIKSDGTIWFTDPPYGITSNEEGYKAESQIIGCYVYCYNPENQAIHIACCDVQRPNGLAFSPDEKKLYVADMSVVDFNELGRCELRIYDIVDNKTINGRTFAPISPGIPDGFCIDKNGYLFCSCEDGIIILDPDGNQINKIKIPERVSNCTFGGQNGNELYITATTSLYRIILN